MTLTDLLCYLVTSQLTARLQSGEWLTPDRLVGCMRTWLAYHRVDCDWLDRVRIASASVTVAQGIYDLASEQDRRAGADDRIWIDANSPQLGALRAHCAALLERLRHARGDGSQ